MHRVLYKNPFSDFNVNYGELSSDGGYRFYVLSKEWFDQWVKFIY